MSRPLVSVILPVYNGETYLAEALQSVFAQDYDPLEVIVLDDGSTDGSAEIAKSFGDRVRYHYQPNQGLGVSTARNKGVELAQGALLSFIDADDVWVPEKTSRQVAVLETDSTIDMVFGTVQQFYSPEMAEELKSQVRFAQETMPGYLAGTLLISREAFARVGPFATTFRVGEFIDWYVKARECGLRERLLSDVLLKRRIHADNMGIRDRVHQKDYLHVLKASLNRRRQSGE